MKSITFLLTILIPTTCFARIGETKAECIKRYGRPVKTDKNGVIAFISKGLAVIVVFNSRGKCKTIRYSDYNGKGLLTFDAAMELVEENTGTHTWHTKGVKDGETQMESENKHWGIAMEQTKGNPKSFKSLMIVNLVAGYTIIDSE